MAQTRALVGILMTATLATAQAPASAEIRKSITSHNQMKTFTNQVLDRRRDAYKFGVAVAGADGYIVDWISVRVSLDYSSGAVPELTKMADNVDGYNFGLIEFDLSDVAQTLGLSRNELKDSGFELHVKIEGVGAGAGRQDRCPPIYFRWSEGKDDWQVPAVPDRTSSRWQTIGGRYTATFLAKGTSNNVKCEFHEDSNDS